MTYWCAIGTIGTLTPASAATSVVYIPHARTTVSASTVPWSVTTALTRPSRTTRSVTRTPVSTATPRDFAPPMNAYVSPLGSRWPSVGSQTPPSTPAGSISGNRSWASAADTSSIGSPNVLAQPCWRVSSSIRSAVDAMRNDPTSCQPGERPVSSASASSRRYTSTLCIIIRVSGSDDRS